MNLIKNLLNLLFNFPKIKTVVNLSLRGIKIIHGLSTAYSKIKHFAISVDFFPEIKSINLVR